MFPKPGSDVPELRFAGFTEPWEQRKLGEMGATYSGLSGKSKEDFGHGGALFVPYTNVFDNPIGDPERLERVEIDESQNVVRRGDALFTVSSETPEEVGMSCVWPSDLDNLYLNSFCFGYRQNGCFDSNYLAYMLRSDTFRNQVEMLAQGISRFNISKGKVMEIEVPVPSKGEQALVGRLFVIIDDLITLHQRKHDQLATLKKSLLEKMFV
jgi:type I restriction enzyme S subunit